MSNVQPVGFDPVPRTSFPSFLVRTATGYEERGTESQLKVPQSCFSAVGGDFDNDMDIDLYLACSWPVTNAENILFENLGNGVFAQIPGGGGASGTPEGRSDTVITADYDEDGFLDLFVTNGEGGPPFDDGPHQLFRNAGNTNHWLEIDLAGRFSNPDAIGARIELSVDQIDIHWPSGIVQTLINIPVDQILAVSETSVAACGDGLDNDGDGLTDYPDDPQCTHWSTGSEADQDGDGVSDALDNCILVPNLDQLDTDQDGSGDACDADDDNDGLSDIFEQSIGTNSLLMDSDGDSLSDYEEVAYDGDPLVYTPGQDLDPNSNDTDADGHLDGVDPIPLVFNFNDGDLAPIGTPDGMINAGDYLIAMQIATGNRQVTPDLLAHGDLYPPNAQDGVINVQDALLLLKLVLQ